MRKLPPQESQRTNLLQMTAPELRNFIAQVLLENPMLEEFAPQEITNEEAQEFPNQRTMPFANGAGRSVAKSIDSDSDKSAPTDPEIYIEKLENDYIIYFADNAIPSLRIKQKNKHGLRETANQTSDLVDSQICSAIDLLRNIEYRHQTLYKVVEAVVRHQPEFLDKGIKHIKPMMLEDVAESIEVPPSIISYAVNRKHVHTPHGVIELRRFFIEGRI